MRHFASTRFWQAYEKLPKDVQSVADKNYALLKENPQRPSLNFKKVDHFWSVRIGIRYRAFGIDVEGGILWFWIGSHADYDAIVG